MPLTLCPAGLAVQLPRTCTPPLQLSSRTQSVPLEKLIDDIAGGARAWSGGEG